MKPINNLDIPETPGVYILHLELVELRSLAIGRHGKYIFHPGEYLYVGSALGPGGLRARLGRHLMGSEVRHWHIDWLRAIAKLRGCFFAATNKPLECTWSQFLMGQPGARVNVPGFGASDCRNEPASCTAHLVWFKTGVDTAWMCDNLPVKDGIRVSFIDFPSHYQPESEDIE